MSISTWLEETFSVLLIYAAKNPLNFLFYILLILSPFFALSAFLSFKLSKAIEKEEKVGFNFINSI